MTRRQRSIILDDELVEDVERYARRNNLTRSAAVAQLLEIALKDETAADNVTMLKANLRKAYKLLDSIMDNITESGYRNRKDMVRIYGSPKNVDSEK